MSVIIGLDPGPKESAIVRWRTAENQLYWMKERNDVLRTWLSTYNHTTVRTDFDTHLVIEDIYPRGMPVPYEAIQTARETGRFIERWQQPYTLIPRYKVKEALCGRMNAKDSNIRQALIDMWGGAREALGAIKCGACKGQGWVGRGRPICDECKGTGWEVKPGPLYKMSGDCWQALAVAVTYRDGK